MPTACPTPPSLPAQVFDLPHLARHQVNRGGGSWEGAGGAVAAAAQLARTGGGAATVVRCGSRVRRLTCALPYLCGPCPRMKCAAGRNGYVNTNLAPLPHRVCC